MPAAAVIPAPIAYADFAAVETLVVGSRRAGSGALFDATAPPARDVCGGPRRGALHRASPRAAGFTLKKSECSEQAPRAWISVHGIME